MSHPKITLTTSDEEGHARRVAVESMRFTIGRATDNDLTIDDPGLSRRHALIESFEGVAEISDCGSESGTFVNGNRVAGSVALKDGDVISIGPAREITVSIIAAPSESALPVARTEAEATRLTTPVIAGAMIVIILAIAVPLLAFLNSDNGNRVGRSSRSQERQAKDVAKPSVDPPRQEDEREANSNNGLQSKSITVEQVEEVAAQVMRRISNDDKAYVFPPYAVNALGDIKQRVEQYSASPALASALNSIATGGREVAAQARREGIEPGLVIYTALAESEGGRASADQAAIARRILSELLSLRKTLGTESADKSLILVAAYRMGGGTKKSHPLLATMRRVVKNPLTDRNVWYLREHGGLDGEPYEFVVSFLALGVIAENPRRFGVTAPPVAF